MPSSCSVRLSSRTAAAGDEWAIVCNCNNLGVAYLLDGHPELAEQLVTDALRTFVEFGDDDGVAESLEALAGVTAATGDAVRILRLASAAYVLRATCRSAARRNRPSAS